MTKAKTAFDERIIGKEPIMERVLDLENYDIEKVILDIITSLGWVELCNKPDEEELQLVREFYANLKEGEDKVFVKDKLVTMTSKAINKLIGAPNHEIEYSVLMDEGVDTKDLEKNLW